MHLTKLKNITKTEAQQIVEILKNMFSSELAEFLIYKDPNYSSYFKNLINASTNDELFVLKEGLEIAGFAHLKVNKDRVFLNNIAILAGLRNAGSGKLLLQFALENIIKERNSRFFSLDVFKKNTPALNWYKKIGMFETGKKYWYDVSPEVKTEYQPNTKLSTQLDKNGFTGVYCGESKIASVINNCLIFKDNESVKLFSRPIISNYVKACLITDQRLNYHLIDSSLRLAIEIDKIKL